MRYSSRMGPFPLARNSAHFDPLSNFFAVLRQDPVLSPRLLLVEFDLPDGRKPVLKVPPEDVGVSEADAARFLVPGHFDPHHVHHPRA